MENNIDILRETRVRMNIDEEVLQIMLSEKEADREGLLIKEIGIDETQKEVGREEINTAVECTECSKPNTSA